MSCLNYVLLNQGKHNRLMIKCLLKVYFKGAVCQSFNGNFIFEFLLLPFSDY